MSEASEACGAPAGAALILLASYLLECSWPHEHPLELQQLVQQSSKLNAAAECARDRLPAAARAPCTKRARTAALYKYRRCTVLHWRAPYDMMSSKFDRQKPMAIHSLELLSLSASSFSSVLAAGCWPGILFENFFSLATKNPSML